MADREIKIMNTVYATDHAEIVSELKAERDEAIGALRWMIRHNPKGTRNNEMCAIAGFDPRDVFTEKANA